MCGDGLGFIIGLLFFLGIIKILFFAGLAWIFCVAAVPLACWLHPWSWFLLGVYVCYVASNDHSGIYHTSSLMVVCVLALWALVSSPYGLLCIGLVCIALTFVFEKHNRRTFAKRYGSARSFIRHKTESLLLGAASYGVLHAVIDSDPISRHSRVQGFMLFAVGYVTFGAFSGRVGEAIELSFDSISSFLVLSLPAEPPSVVGANEAEEVAPKRTGTHRIIAVYASVAANAKSWYVTGTNMAGDSIGSFHASRDVTLYELQTAFSTHLAVHREEVKLILPDARCLADLPGSRRLATVIETTGMTLRSKRGKQRQKAAKHQQHHDGFM
mmetsp:Transcript_66379/g.122611  ORF Transcript_66379/g.122611 Transcript_66379/m.122611 type:complete len:327 (-) Transcript_66379:122-1102(-)